MPKILIICGPTATGKTSFGLEMAKKYNGEIISADSRQVYTGMDIVTGKDIPLSLIKRGDKGVSSSIRWKNKFLKYYLIKGIRVWLYDVVTLDEPFNVSFWKQCADLVIRDILSRGKLPIVVGGTGLYIKSLTQHLSQIDIPPNPKLRARLEGKSADYLFNHLNRLDPFSSAKINQSDKSNPRRLVRAIEIALHTPPSLRLREGDQGGELFKKGKLGEGLGGRYDEGVSYLTLALFAPKEHLYSMIDKRVEARVAAGAVDEAQQILKEFNHSLPSLTASGYRAFLDPDPLVSWKTREHQYARRQLTWFKKQPDITWFDITKNSWKNSATSFIDTWYNNSDAQES